MGKDKTGITKGPAVQSETLSLNVPVDISRAFKARCVLAGKRPAAVMAEVLEAWLKRTASGAMKSDK